MTAYKPLGGDLADVQLTEYEPMKQDSSQLRNALFPASIAQNDAQTKNKTPESGETNWFNPAEEY